MIIDKLLLMQFASVTIGTFRGVLHAKTEGTKFNIIHIPIVDMLSLEIEELELKLP